MKTQEEVVRQHAVGPISIYKIYQEGYQDMKPGDKVWFYDHDRQEIVTATVLLYESIFDDGDCVEVQFDNTGTKTIGLKDGVNIFPTREALCEHYRKIFE